MKDITKLSNEELLALQEQPQPDITQLSNEDLLAMSGQQPPVAQPAAPSLTDKVAGFVEPIAAIGSGIIAEPLAGLTGIVHSVSPFTSEGAGARAVQETRESLTYQPRTESGKEALASVGETLKPIGEAISGAETFLGDKVFEATNSPALASAAATLPTAILEAIGLRGGGRVARSSKKIEPSSKAIRKSLNEAAPTPDELQGVSRKIYKELDESNVTISPESYKQAVADIKKAAKGQGLSARTTPRAMGVIEDLEDVAGTAPSLSEIDDLRKVANGVAKSMDRTEAALGSRIVSELDSYLDDLPDEAIVSGTLSAKEILPKYQAARQLWGRARKGELIADTIEKAKRRGSGFENGLRVEFDKILNNKKLNRFFRDSELAAMRNLVEGDVAQNFAKLIGRFGFGEGRASNVVGGVLGTVLGSTAGGTPGVLAAVTVGSAARKVAQKLTKNKADFIDSITRAGAEGEDIVKAYLNTVPKKSRSIKDLSELLSDPSIDLTDLVTSSDKLIREATDIAAGRQVIGELVGVGAAGVASGSKEK